MAPSEEGAGAPEGYKGATEGEITRGRCLLRGVDEHGVKKRSFAFSLAYIKCFRTYSLYLSLRLPAQILYAGIHLPPQREARALPRRAQKSTASAIRSRTCGRQRLAFLAVSATGGARKPTVQGELDFRLVLQAEKTEGLYRRPVIAFTLIFCTTILLCVFVSWTILTPFLL